jgi:hypothetical protein
VAFPVTRSAASPGEITRPGKYILNSPENPFSLEILNSKEMRGRMGGPPFVWTPVMSVRFDFKRSL